MWLHLNEKVPWFTTVVGHDEIKILMSYILRTWWNCIILADFVFNKDLEVINTCFILWYVDTIIFWQKLSSNQQSIINNLPFSTLLSIVTKK